MSRQGGVEGQEGGSEQLNLEDTSFMKDPLAKSGFHFFFFFGLGLDPHFLFMINSTKKVYDQSRKEVV